MTLNNERITTFLTQYTTKIMCQFTECLCLLQLKNQYKL